MKSIRLLSVAEQTAEHLRQRLNEGHWNGKLPGVVRLAADCSVSAGVIRKALGLLEEEGLLSGRGLGRSRSIAASALKAESRPLRVAILRHDERMEDNPQTSMVLAKIMHSLEVAGHEAFFCRKSQVEMKHQVGRLSRQLVEVPADAWVIESGSHSLLEWCSQQTTPCLALYGSTDNLPLARYGPNVESAFRTATRHLLALGHRRIVLIISEARRKPTPGRCACAYLDELRTHGVVTGDYNLPDWRETPEGLEHLLNNLFKNTPPTALIIDEIPHFFAALTYCARRGIRVPDHVSLVSVDCTALADWCHQGIARMRWDNEIIVRRVARWVNALRRGRTDRRLIDFPAEFVPGGSIGPVWKR